MRGRPLYALAIVLVACGGGDAAARVEDDDPSSGDVGAPQAPGAQDGEGGAVDEEPAPDVPYDRAIQKSVHNAYERHEPIVDQLVYHRVRSLELDIHVRRQGTTAPNGDWFVLHDDNPIGRVTSCSRLSDCLGQLAAFHEALPRHEVVTLFVDIKTAFTDGHQPADLDAALVKGLGRDRLVTPADLLAACPGAASLREAVTGACRFPTLGALRGKFLVAVTGGSSCNASSFVATYGGAAPSDRVAFVAPNVDGKCPVAAYDERPDVVFFNMPLAERARATEVKSLGLVARVYGGGVGGGLDSRSAFAMARDAGAAHLATDKVSFETDGWSRTHLPLGFPFTCDGCPDDLVEPGHVVGIRAASDDLWGTADSGVFAYETDDEDAEWSALVSVPSSHVKPFAKACLVARASEDPDAANVAVCRTFDAHAPRAQVRSITGGSTRATSASSFAGVTAETPAFLKLAVKGVGSSSEVTASASHDGKTWATIVKTALPMRLPVRGVAVSSHGSGTVKGLFANLVRARGGARTVVSTASLHVRPIGAGAAGDAFDGVFPP